MTNAKKLETQFQPFVATSTKHTTSVAPPGWDWSRSPLHSEFNFKVWGERVVLLGRALPRPSRLVLTFQQFLTKILKLKNGAKESIV